LSPYAVQSYLPAKKGESLGCPERGRLGMVLGPEWVRRAEPEQGRKEAAWSELRVVVLAKRVAEAHEVDPFFEMAAEKGNRAQGLSLRAEKPMFRVKGGESEGQVVLGF
jgi:hypothetical protein